MQSEAKLSLAKEPTPDVVLSEEASALFMQLVNARESIEAQLRALVPGAGLSGQFHSRVDNGRVSLFRVMPEAAQ